MFRMRGGHRFGGPFAFLVLWTACGGPPSGNDPRPDPGRPLESYRELGLLAGSTAFPAVAAFNTLAGPADSTWVLFGLSLPASALRFQREGVGFTGEYQVAVTFTRDSITVHRFEARERVHVPTFAETGRTDESVVFQRAVTLRPGRYIVDVTAADGRGSRGFRARDTLDVPDYRTATLAPPVIVYESEARTSLDDPPELVLNPRRTAAYGGEPPRLHIEAYHAHDPVSADIRVLDPGGNPIWTGAARIEEGDSVLRTAVVALPADTLPLGRVSVEVTNGAVVHAAELVISISDEWMVANFDEVLEILRLIATEPELDSLAAASQARRRALWEAFWSRRDPLASTPANEFRDEFFDRVRSAAERFGEPPEPGWKTDRGAVYIVLGPPDQVVERWSGRETSGAPVVYEWIYVGLPGGRIDLSFRDRTGFGRYELAPASRAVFRTVAERLRPRS